MVLRCPLCSELANDDGELAGHLAFAHGLHDDPGLVPAEGRTAEADAHLAGGFVPPGAATGFDRPQTAEVGLGPRQFAPPPSFLPPPPTPPANRWPGAPHPGTQHSTSSTTIIVGVVVAVVGLFAAAFVVLGTSRRDTGSRIGAPASTSLGSKSAAQSAASPTASPVYADSTGADNVDPQEALSVANRLWQDVNTALHDHNIDSLNNLESGPALDADAGTLRVACASGCPDIPVPSSGQMTVNVPHQGGWPAMFLASVKYTDACRADVKPCVELFVAVQPARGGPWTMHLRTSYGGHHASEDPAVLPDGFAAVPDSAAVPDTTLLTDYAEYFDTFKRTGQPPDPSRFDAGPFTTGLSSWALLLAERQQQAGFNEDVDYRADLGSGVFVFATSDNTTTTCGTIRYTTTATALPGQSISSSTIYQVWGGNLASGNYTAVHAEGLHETCFETRTGPPVIVTGIEGSTIEVTAQRR